MKKIYQISLIVTLTLISISCNRDFDEINTSKTAPTTIDPIFLLNGATINTSYTTGFAGGTVLIYDMGVVQQIISPLGGVVAGANFNFDNRQATASHWQNYYRNVIKNTKDIIRAIKDDANRTNLLSMTRILQAYAFMVLTDEYGDVPYAQAGVGYLEQIFNPAYDPQEFIYEDIINELTQATAALDNSKRVETADILYAGNVDKWRRFGYSLLLRAGMRLSKVNPSLAETTVLAAFQGGVITSNQDNAVIRHDNNYLNGTGNTLNSTEGTNFYLAAPFVAALEDDPRLQAIAVRYPTATSGSDQIPANGTTDPANQIGLPVGYGGDEDIELPVGVTTHLQISQVDRTRMANRQSPVFLVTAAQSQLLLAEARFRGWITTGTASEYFENGVRAHMEQLGSYHPNSAISSSAIDDYIDDNPYNAGAALEQINTQYWIASFLNGPEAFANFRRSGYPDLTPNTVTGPDLGGEDFIRRLTYPVTEISVNSVNVELAISSMGGPDNLGTRVWWDVP